MAVQPAQPATTAVQIEAAPTSSQAQQQLVPARPTTAAETTRPRRSGGNHRQATAASSALAVAQTSTAEQVQQHTSVTSDVAGLNLAADTNFCAGSCGWFVAKN